jgi:3-isopropylmalate/(R)-2-methylmalate dehydratase large subunit
MSAASGAPRTIARKIWDSRRILSDASGASLLSVDQHYLNETSFISFQELERLGRMVRRPQQSFLMVDHTVPTVGRAAGMPAGENRDAVAYLQAYARRTGMPFIGLDDPRQGIGHIVTSELGLTVPGLLIAGDDSHTTTNGAMGALALGIGLSEVTHVLATQALWQPQFGMMRVRLSGRPGPWVDAKDIVLHLIGTIGAAGAIGHIVEYDGTCVRELSMAQRMTLCNMTVEAGGRAAIVAPDQTTLDYLRGRPCAPEGADWDRAAAEWLALATDADAPFDKEVEIRVGDVAPTVTWGTSPQDTVPVDGVVPDPATAATAQERNRMRAALDYMALAPGTRITDVPVDQVFIGSCTNGRIEDFRAAAAVLAGRKAVVPGIAVPGSSEVKRQAEAEGLDRVFREAGFDWREPGCSMCLGMNGDLVAAGRRCASTTNRNFMGRQGQGARTHLMGPAMAAAAAVTGRIADVRQVLGSR